MTPKRHDAGAKTLFGQSRNFDAAGFCDTVLAQPKSAAYVAGRLWQQLASDDPPSAPVLDRLVAAYGSQPRPACADPGDPHRQRVHRAAAHSVVNTPVEWLVGVIRALRVPIDDPKRMKMIDATLRRWVSDRSIRPASAAGPRAGLAVDRQRRGPPARRESNWHTPGDLSGIESAAPGDRADAVGYLIGVGSWSDRTVKALRPLVRHPAQLVAAAVNTPEYLTS